jgi:hypothetical protein
MDHPGKNGSVPGRSNEPPAVYSQGSQTYRDEESDDLAIAREQLERADAKAAIAGNLDMRVAAVATTIAQLTQLVDSVCKQLDACWSDQVLSLQGAHEQCLRKIFPNGVPDNCQLEFERLSGLTAVEEDFGRLMSMIRGAVPDYPDETRHPDEID